MINKGARKKDYMEGSVSSSMEMSAGSPSPPHDYSGHSQFGMMDDIESEANQSAEKNALDEIYPVIPDKWFD